MSFPRITPERPALILAPMEGLTDSLMRTVLSERGGFSFCVSEFLRISQEVPPVRTFLEHVPELKTNAKTPSGVPVQIQLLGGNEDRMALSALRACEAGAKALDLNFGCPAPTVNRHDGGASLLRHPERIRKIVTAVRRAVPSEIPVSAKLRLGWETMEDILINAEQAALGGASWLTIHARTKTQGYAPPAHWRYIAEVRRSLDIPVVANGEIWTLEDFLRCREITGCTHYMLGRGALADPTLVHAIAREMGISIPSAPTNETHPIGRSPGDWEPILSRFAEISAPYAQKTQYTSRRIKGWLKFAQMRAPLPWYEDLKRAKNLEEVLAVLRR